MKYDKWERRRQIPFWNIVHQMAMKPKPAIAAFKKENIYDHNKF